MVMIKSCLFSCYLGCWASSDRCVFLSCDSKNHCERKIEECRRPDKKVVHCYSAWKNESGTVKLMKQGCFLNSITCSRGPDCIGRSHLRGVIYCCCTGNLCNENFTSVINLKSTYITKPPPSEGKIKYYHSHKIKCNDIQMLLTWNLPI